MGHSLEGSDLRALLAHPMSSTEMDSKTGVLLARNPGRMEFGSSVAFADLAGEQRSCTGDRTEFIGRNGAFALPAALASPNPLSNRVGAGLDPCSVVRNRSENPAETGRSKLPFCWARRGRDREALLLVERFRAADLDEDVRDTASYWNQTLGSATVQCASAGSSRIFYLLTAFQRALAWSWNLRLTRMMPPVPRT